MKESLRTGMSFGLTSGIITTLGLLVGLHAGTHSKPVVIGGILTIAIADSLSDALGIHISQESQNRHNTQEVWESTFATFTTKIIIALTFLLPILLLPNAIAITVSVTWGLFLLVALNLYLAHVRQEQPWRIVVEHLVIASLVIGIAYLVGVWIETQLLEVSS